MAKPRRYNRGSSRKWDKLEGRPPATDHLRGGVVLLGRHPRGRKAKTLLDYHKLASAKQLIFAATSLPRNTNTFTLWRCLRCPPGTPPFVQTYQRLASDGYGCPVCNQRVRRRTIDQYRALADLNHLELIGEKPTARTTPTTWRKTTGEIIECSYADLAEGTPGVW